MNRLMIRHTMDKPLPYDAEVEWIESTGTQYIDTGISGSSAISISLDILLPDTTNSGGCFFGSRIANLDKAYNLVLSKEYLWRYGSNYGYNTFNNTSDRRLLFDNTSVHNEMCIYEGDTLISTLTVPSDNFENYRNLYLFAGNNADNLSRCPGLRLYGCKMYRNSVIIRDFTPVRKGNTGYLYDKVSGQLFGNQGTGDFVVGPDYDPFAYQYLTFVPLEDSTFSFSKRGTGNDIEYSIDGGAWTSLASEANTPTVGAGHNIRWRSELVPSTASDNQGIGTFSATGLYDAMGNTMSLLYGDNFVGQTTLVGTYTFYQLWYQDNHIYRADRVVLPATKLVQRCYAYMFEECSSLISVQHVLPATMLTSYCYYRMYKDTAIDTAPLLPASILTSRCYSYMFSRCTNLKYVKMLATDKSATNCLNNWVSGVASKGTFVKHSQMTTLPTGVSGIPDGWTVVDDPSTITT